jgi:hypothetical protein
MMMIPSEVFTAQAENSFIPRKYRLSNTFTGSACHVSFAGGPGGGAGVVPLAGAGPPRRVPGPVGSAEQSEVNST